MPSYHETVGTGAAMATEQTGQGYTVNEGEDGETVIRVNTDSLISSAASAAVGTLVGAYVSKVVFNDDGS